MNEDLKKLSDALENVVAVDEKTQCGVSGGAATAGPAAGKRVLTKGGGVTTPPIASITGPVASGV